MRILLNCLCTLKAKTGIGHYVDELDRALQRLGRDDQIVRFPGPLSSRIGRSVARRLASSNSYRRAGNSGQSTSKLKRIAQRAAGHFFTVASWGRGFDLYHEPNYIPFPTSLPTVLTIHDLSALLHPEWHPADRVLLHRQKLKASAERATQIITGTETVRREIVQTLGLPVEKVRIVPYGIGPEFRPQDPATVRDLRQKLDLPERFFLSVGTIEPRKNILTLMKAFADLPAAVRRTCPMILAGGWGWKSEPERDYFESTGRAAGVRHLGYVADGDRPALYAAATVLAFPSRYEGYGLPPLEMLACGGSVLAGSAASVRELLGPTAAYRDSDDLGSWRDALLDFANHSGPQQSQLRCPAQSITWDRVAQMTLAVYREALGRGEKARSAGAAA